jgi:Tfp pilus assembly protein PilN
MQAVNLLPAYARPAGRWASLGKELSPARVVRMGGLIAVVAAVAVGAAWYYERSVVSDRHATLQDTKARLAAVEATAAPLHAAEADSTGRQAIVRSVVASRVQWEKVLHDLAAVLPDQVYLQSLQVQPASAAPVVAPDTGSSSTTGTTSASPAPVGASGQLTVAGAANSHVRVALILDRLALLPWLSDITLQSSTHGGGAAGDNFSITAGFTGSEATG